MFLFKEISIVLSLLVLAAYGTQTQSSSTLFYGGTVISFNTTTSSFEILRSSSLHIVDDRIHAFYAKNHDVSLPANTQYINVTNHIICPGFIDTHRHGWQTAFKTIASNTTLAEYFYRYSEYASAGKFTAEDVYLAQLLGVLEALNAGVTTILDHAHGVWDEATADAGLKGSMDSGGRVFHAVAIHELGTNYTIAKQIAKIKSLAAAGLGNSNVELGLAYDGWQGSASDVSMVVNAVKSTNLSVLTTHALGGPWGFTNPPSAIHSLQLLNTSVPFVFSHASFLQPEDAGLLRETNQHVSITPESEFLYGHGNPYSHLIMDQASIGVDTHFTMSTDIVTQARMWLSAVRHRLYNDVLLGRRNVPSSNPMSANQALLMATRNGGLSLHRDDLGVIKVGAKADLVIYNGLSPSLLGWVDPVAAVVLHSNVGDILHVLVNGKFVKKDGKLTITNYEALQQKFLVSAKKLQKTWHDLPPVVLEGGLNSFGEYEHPKQADVVRGVQTGYDVEHLEL